jgi:hypothetical protein
MQVVEELRRLASKHTRLEPWDCEKRKAQMSVVCVGISKKEKAQPKQCSVCSSTKPASLAQKRS